ncbi:serine hydrolase [Cryptosporangium sp. NPDC048952]|uniref:serine hydrolase domain-containing protein n=1 Tax=Cryptosporangium sp. NPDC048952 TaxID=3363961 RepID=UPI00371D13D7
MGGRAAAVCVLVGSAVVAASPAQAAPPTCEPPTAAADYFHRAVPQRMGDTLPGMVVSVVSGDKTVYTHGFGRADVAKNVPMDPDRTLVRIASITKLFTATAVMQQVEAGRLDLNADVDTYLKDFSIPRTYPQPITLQMLLAHTAGFEDRIIGTGARTADEVVPLGKYLAENMPARIRPPGVVSAYSNYGAALAGYIVTQVSGEPYDKYVQRHILDPLHMIHTTATEPVPPGTGDLATSYRDNGETIPFTFDPLTPDGSISATASDMAKFAIAHLNEGAGILRPETTALMHTRSFAADPRLTGYAHGFINRTMNGHHVLMHDGSWEGFGSGLLLVPDCKLGVFVSVNSTEGFEALGDVVDGFLDRFAPGSAPTVSGSQKPVVPEAGFYAPTRRNVTGVEKLLTLLGPARLTVTDSGSLRFKGQIWTPQGDGSYVAGDDRLVAIRGGDGTRYVATDGPTFERLSWWWGLPFNLGVLAVFAVVALSALAVPIVGLWRRVRRRELGASRSWRVSRGLAAGAAVLGLGFLVGLAAALFGSTSEFLYSAPTSFRVLLVVPIVVTGMAAVALGTAVAGWRGAGIMARVHQVVLLAGLASLVWFCWQWNVLGWHFS